MTTAERTGPVCCDRCRAPYVLMVYGELACAGHALEILELAASRPCPLRARLRRAVATLADGAGHWLADCGCQRARDMLWNAADWLRG